MVSFKKKKKKKKKETLEGKRPFAIAEIEKEK